MKDRKPPFPCALLRASLSWLVVGRVNGAGAVSLSSPPPPSRGRVPSSLRAEIHHEDHDDSGENTRSSPACASPSSSSTKSSIKRSNIACTSRSSCKRNSAGKLLLSSLPAAATAFGLGTGGTAWSSLAASSVHPSPSPASNRVLELQRPFPVFSQLQDISSSLNLDDTGSYKNYETPGVAKMNPLQGVGVETTLGRWWRAQQEKEEDTKTGMKQQQQRVHEQRHQELARQEDILSPEPVVSLLSQQLNTQQLAQRTTSQPRRIVERGGEFHGTWLEEFDDNYQHQTGRDGLPYYYNEVATIGEDPSSRLHYRDTLGRISWVEDYPLPEEEYGRPKEISFDEWMARSDRMQFMKPVTEIDHL
ncbi:unnamed protein product [Amoebophrya sp. A25]|nr:unnamed protein product [Amoebophrya sp. A25]|eukprot:GSA25T00014668001.1